MEETAISSVNVRIFFWGHMVGKLCRVQDDSPRGTQAFIELKEGEDRIRSCRWYLLKSGISF